jgi:accessory gene regulator protein AgrB
MEVDMEHKKGTGQNPAPKEDIQVNYNKLQSFCLRVTIIAIIIFLIAYLIHNDKAIFLSLGMMLHSILIQAFVNSNEEDNEND